jgi:beta-propeller uncharacterized protein DUF5122
MNRAGAAPVISRRKGDKAVDVAVCVRAWAWRSVIALLMTLSLVLLGHCTPGDLDLTSSAGGTITTDFGGGDAAAALVLQPDGKLVASGVSSGTASFSGNFALARYLPDGLLDATFGTEFEINVNALVTFERIPSTFTFTSDPDVPFVICLTQQQPFTILPLACRVVNALGAGHMDMPLVQPSGHA